MRKTDMWVQQLDGRFRRVLYSNIVKLPRALAVHPLLGYAYMTDWGAQAFIGRAAMDGSQFTKLITTGIVWPNALTIDYYANRVYWADAFLDTIE
jgi:low density lipoprotein-related protein 2